MADWGGLIAGALAGGGEALQKSAARELIEMAQAERDARLAEISKENTRYAVEQHEESAKRQKEAERAAKGEAAKKAKGLIEKETTYAADVPGIATPIEPSRARKAEIEADAYSEAGFDDEAMRRRQLAETITSGERQESQQRRADARGERQLDITAQHYRATEANQAATNKRLTDLAAEQIAGLKLDNAQKKQLADLDKKYNESTDPKEREKLAQDRLLLTGKWSETFEVKTGVNPQTGEPTVLGYIDKRRGTFTTPDGTVTDMRTGKKTGGGGAAGAPTAGAVVGGFKFKGGNPNDRSNWEQADPVLGGEGGFKPSRSKTDVTKPAAPAPKTYPDPISGERITAAQWRKKFGEDPKEG